MPSRKVKLSFITNNSARKATYKKRKKSLMKMVSQLSTLCGIEACAVIYSPYEVHPEVWPSPEGTQHVLSRFKNLSEEEQTRKMVDQVGFLNERISKTSDQLKKQCRDNREMELTHAMFQNLSGQVLHNLNIIDLNHLGFLIEKNIMDINKRVDTLINGASPSSQQPAAAAATATATEMLASKATTRSGPENVWIMHGAWS